jgi:hypothetical protein
MRDGQERLQAVEGMSNSSGWDDTMRTRMVSPPRHPSPLSKRRADTERLEAQLAEWTAVIAQLRSRAKRSEAEARVRMDRIADGLQLLRNQAGTQVMLLKSSLDLDWEVSVSDLDRSWGGIRSAFQEVEASY